MPFSLWENNFAGLATALITYKYHCLSFPYPTHLDPKFPEKVNINKINKYAGTIGTSKKDERKQGLKLIPSNLYCRRTPGFAAILRIKFSKQKLQSHNQQFCPFTFLQPTHGSNIIFCLTAGPSYTLKPPLPTCFQIPNALKQ